MCKTCDEFERWITEIKKSNIPEPMKQIIADHLQYDMDEHEEATVNR